MSPYRRNYAKRKRNIRKEAWEATEKEMKHLDNTTYLKHLKFAWLISAKLAVLVIVGLVHGLFPFIFPSYISSKVHQLNSEFDNHVG